MRTVVQRVLTASVTVDGKILGEIEGPGLLVLLGVTHDDGLEQVAWMARKIWSLRILRDALEVPIRQIALNSGADPGVVAERVRNSKGAFGFDSKRMQYADLDEAGIIDPTQVVRTALENAASVAGTLLLAEATLTDVEEKSPAAAAPTGPPEF